jgi:hypothetical protein
VKERLPEGEALRGRGSTRERLCEREVERERGSVRESAL